MDRGGSESWTPGPLDWRGFRERWVDLLERRTGVGLKTWNQRVNRSGSATEAELRKWLVRQGVEGYPQTLLVMEKFGYPANMVASASELLDAQFAGRANLRAIYDAVISAVRRFGDVEIQVRKPYVSLLTARRTFARIQVARGDRLAVGLRLPGRPPVGRLKPSSIHESMRVQLELAGPRDLRGDAVKWLKTAFKANG